MHRERVPGEEDPPATDGAVRPAHSAPTGVYPSVTEPRADGSSRYIVYTAGIEGRRVADCWLSVDLDVVVARENWR